MGTDGVGEDLRGQPVRCVRRGCWDTYAQHTPGGKLGECSMCFCAGFLWVQPATPGRAGRHGGQ